MGLGGAGFGRLSKIRIPGFEALALVCLVAIAYLLGIGRRKLILPLYSELIKTPAGKVRAVEIYRQARSGYHPLAQTSIDQLLGVKP